MIDDIKYKETISRDNDYTLRVEQAGSNYESGVTFTSRITRLFNFLSAQVTTTTREIAHPYSSGQSPALTTTVTNQRFDEFQSDGEIRLMHAKLKELGGTPPALEETLDKKQLRSASVKGLNA